VRTEASTGTCLAFCSLPRQYSVHHSPKMSWIFGIVEIKRGDISPGNRKRCPLAIAGNKVRGNR
jgi:hypothetical protein